ncbi:MAG: ABC transporter permease [Anaerolineae bacterium]|jgi:ABC-type dipeptide/oligopeptide/nickel transport system permease component|nr:ABC transporter permease [Anaerolineae bacterium]
MGKYIARRLAQSVIVLLGVTLLAFVTLHLAGDPTYLYVSERASEQEIIDTRARLGFDRPLPEQYLSFVVRMFQGDLGVSLRSRKPALEMVMERLPATLELTICAMLFSTLLAIPVGILCATRRGTPLDGGIMLLAMMGQSMPGFWLGIMLMLFVGLQLRWLPISGHEPVLEYFLRGDFARGLQNLPQAIPYLILPSITIGVFSLSRNARLVRSSMLEVLNQEYITTARSKGLTERNIIVRHAMKNAMLPVVTLLGLEFGFLLSGVVVTETVFSWPGVGRLVFNAITQRDIPVVQAAVVTFSFMFILLNLLVDIIYVQLDPRIRLS